MAGEIKISQLPLAAPAQDADVTAGVQSGTTVKQTNSALFTYIESKLETSGQFLLSANNLSDVQSASTSRVNLGINFQNTYSLGSTFNLSSAGFAINNSLGNPLLDFSTSDGINFGVALYAQNGIALSNATTGSFTQFNGSSITNYTNLDTGATNPNFTFTAQSAIPSNTFATAGNYQFGFSDESSSPSGFFKLNLIDGGPTNPILYASGATSSTPALISINSQLRIGPSFSPANANVKLLVNGSDSSGTAAPGMGFFTDTDGYPLLQILPFTHGTTLLNFDCYSSAGTYHSSSVGSNFQIAKSNNQLQFNFNSGTSPGSGFGFSQAGYFDISGNLTLSQKLIVGNPSGSTNALVQFNSSQYGILPPVLTDSAQTVLVSLLGSADNGLEWYNSTDTTRNYWDGAVVQQGLTFQKLLAGSNITFDDSTVPGSRIINAVGGGTAPTASFASWAIQNNAVTTSVQTSFTTVGTPPDGSNFFNINSSDFTNQIQMVNGLYTAISTYIGTSTQYFSITANMGLVTSSSNPAYLTAIAILTSGGSTVTNQGQMSMNFPGTGQNLPESVTAILQLSPGDSVFLQIASPSGAANCKVKDINFKISSIAGSIVNSNGLPQGSNNLYLSQNGGSTYQYLSGSAIIGDLPQFSSTGGQFSDSGIAVSNVILSTGSYSNPSWLTSLDGSKLTGTVTPNSSAGGDLSGSYPNPAVASNAITYAKFQQIVANSLFGNPSGSTANGQAISLGSTLSFSGSALQTLALSGDITSPANSFVTTLATVNSNVGTFGSATQVPQFTVTGKGLVTSVSNVTISGVTPGGSAGGDLSGTYPNPTVAKINTVPVASSTVSDGQLLIGSTSGANYSAATLTGTSNQVNVANASHAITLSLPQSIATSSSPQFNALGIGTNSFDFSGVNLQITNNSASGANAVISTTLTGSSNQAALYLSRGDAVNGNAVLRFWTGVAGSGTPDWDVGTFNSGVATNTSLVFRSGGSNWLTLSNTGVLNLSQLTASNMVATDSSKNLVSIALPLGVNTIVTVTGSSQSMALQTRYINNYNSAQCAYTLPAATGSGKIIELISLTTASLSGWKVTANGTDKIQFGSSLSASGGNITSTVSSSSDCATFCDAASGLWAVYPALGANLVVT